MSTSFPSIDLALARRLERAEGAANAACVEARRDLHPHVGAAWMEVGASQGNARRQGFRPVYVRAKWQRNSSADL
jgi:hypothetical protein